MADTIVALSTPLGRSGIGIIRLSGAEALRMATSLAGGIALEPRRATLATLRDTRNEALDEAVITYFKGPNSFTGEDVIEISCHGAPVILRAVIDLLLAAGARMADPGEFTLRALAHGRIDLAEAEAIRDLIDAQSTGAARQAVRQLRGELSHSLQHVKDDLLDVIVILESALEFVEDDLPEMESEKVRIRLTLTADTIAGLASTFSAGRLLREGLKVALAGRPNVGKSSLFNALLGTDRAIVTEIAGTTRDQLHERFTIGEIPISLIDTAGLRETNDTVESIGVERARRAVADADLVLAMIDASEPISAEDRAILESIQELEHLVVLNKIDKLSAQADQIAGQIGAEFGIRPEKIVLISAKTGEGLEALKQAIVGPFSANSPGDAGFLISDARHHDLLLRADNEIRSSIASLEERASEEIVLIGLHNALRYLGEITGETTTEDMLTRIFSTFCIGK